MGDSAGTNFVSESPDDLLIKMSGMAISEASAYGRISPDSDRLTFRMLITTASNHHKSRHLAAQHPQLWQYSVGSHRADHQQLPLRRVGPIELF